MNYIDAVVLIEYTYILDVHKLCEFMCTVKKLKYLIVFAMETICEKDLKEDNRYFSGVIEILCKFPHVLNH